MKNLIFCCIIYFLFIYSRLSAQPTYSLLYDHTLSPFAGAETQIALHHAITKFDLPIQLFDEKTVWTKSAGVVYRLGKTVFLDNIIDYLPYIVQHEVFGHGARFREFNLEEIRYSINLFPPYGNGSGGAGAKIFPTNLEKSAAISLGGVDAESRLSRSILLTSLQSGKIHHRQLFLTWFGLNGLRLYVWGTNPERYLAGNDIIAYVGTVNGLYKQFGLTTELKVQDLKQQLWLEFLNPWQYFLLYAYWMSYVWEGEKEWAIPMIRFGDVGYLPSLRFAFGMFGSEAYFDNFITYRGMAGLIYFRHTLSSPIPVFGLGAEFRSVYSNSIFTLGGKIDLWSQQNLEFEENNTTVNEGHSLGVSLTIMANAWMHEFNGYKLGVVTHLGYKTRGFVQNEPLERGLLFRFGLSFALPD